MLHDFDIRVHSKWQFSKITWIIRVKF